MKKLKTWTERAASGVLVVVAAVMLYAIGTASLLGCPGTRTAVHCSRDAAGTIT